MAERTIGKVTTASASGGAIGAALAQILVHLVPSLSPVETAITVILTAVLGLLGGYLVPPKEEHLPVEVKIDSDAVLEKINENPSQYLERIEFDPGNHDFGYVASFSGEVDPDLASPGDVLELRLNGENAGTVTVRENGRVAKFFREGEITGPTLIEVYTRAGARAYATQFNWDKTPGKHVAE